MKTVAKMYRGQYRAVEEALETWKVDHDEAMGVCDLEEVICVLLRLQPNVLKLVRVVWEKGSSGKIDDPQEIGQLMLTALNAAVKAWQLIEKSAAECAKAGYDVNGSEHSPSALATVTAARDDFAGRWPLYRTEDAERGAKEIAAGKFVTGEELLRELQGQGD